MTGVHWGGRAGELTTLFQAMTPTSACIETTAYAGDELVLRDEYVSSCDECLNDYKKAIEGWGDTVKEAFTRALVRNDRKKALSELASGLALIPVPQFAVSLRDSIARLIEAGVVRDVGDVAVRLGQLIIASAIGDLAREYLVYVVQFGNPSITCLTKPRKKPGIIEAGDPLLLVLTLADEGFRVRVYWGRDLRSLGIASAMLEARERGCKDALDALLSAYPIRDLAREVIEEIKPLKPVAIYTAGGGLIVVAQGENESVGLGVEAIAEAIASAVKTH